MIRRFWLLSLGVLVLGGCGKELTAGGLREGEVSAVATDDAGASSARQPSFARAGEASAQRASGSILDGAVDLTVAVSLVDESGVPTPITDGPAPAQVAIGSSASVPLGTESVREGRYPVVRLTFTDVTARVQGLPLAGATFAGTVVVDLGGRPLAVDVPAPVQVRAGGRSRVVLHLNSAAWLPLAQLAAPTSALVPATAFRQAVTVTVE